jgi:hypothetical protein
VQTEADEFDLRDIVVSVEDGHVFPLQPGKSILFGRIEDGRDLSDRVNKLSFAGQDDLVSPYEENRIETHNFWFFRLNHASCQRYLERDIGPETEFADSIPIVRAQFPPNQIGANVEVRLYDENPKHSLFAQFVADVERRKTALENYRQERSAEFESRRAAARRRWHGK